VILEKQGNFLHAFRDYITQTARLRSAQADFDAIKNGAGTEWNKYDPRIAPYMRTSAEQLLVYQAQRAQQARAVLLGLTSESFLNDTDKAFGGEIDWTKTQKLSSKTSLLARNEQSVSPEMGLYSQTAERLFMDKFPGFAPSLVIVAKVNRTGMTEQVHVLKSAGKSSLDEEAVRVAKQLALPPFPKSYTGDHWFLILRKFAFVPRIQPTAKANPAPLTQTEIELQTQQNRNTQEHDMQAKKLRYGVSYPWEMTEPYGLVRER
jgi:multidrug efflux pump subunit AcrA (membrane-fusion protein)